MAKYAVIELTDIPHKTQHVHKTVKRESWLALTFTYESMSHARKVTTSELSLYIHCEAKNCTMLFLQ